MKLNQFAYYNPNNEFKKKELINIKLISKNFDKNDFFTNLYQIIDKLFPNMKTESSKKEQKQRILIQKDLNLNEFLNKKPDKMTSKQFNNMALQLLDFTPFEEYNINNPSSFMKDVKLLSISKDILNNNDLITAFYLLLNMRTKHNLSFIDELANEGFYDNFLNSRNHKHVFFNGKSQPVFDTRKLIKEVVYVESPLDTDKDGKRDLLAVTILRPYETESGLKVPAIYTANPYYCGINEKESDKITHNVNKNISLKNSSNKFKKPNYEYHITGIPQKRTSKKEQKESEIYNINGSNNRVYTLNEYLSARGFAIVYAGGIGTRFSDGIRITGSKEETISTISVIQWLNNQQKAYTNKNDNIEIKAWWCNGNVAMTGKSYLGTLATAAATTGVKGLKTIISEAAISSWYDYYRENGLVVAPENCQGEDTDVLAEFTNSRRKDAGDWIKVKDIFHKNLEYLKKGQDRLTGNYNEFWDERNYRNDSDKIKCDIIYVHGLNDHNVKLRNVQKIWQCIQKLPINKKIILHQGKHIYINNFQSIDFNDIINLWLSYELLNVPNNAPKIIPNVIVQDNTKEETWETHKNWLSNKYITYYFNKDDILYENQQLSNNIYTKSFIDNGVETFLKSKIDEKQWKIKLLSDNSNYNKNRLIWKSENLKNDLYISGIPIIECRVKLNSNVGLISAELVDYGLDKRLNNNPSILMKNGIKLSKYGKNDDLVEFQLDKKTTNFKSISKGHINLQNRSNNWTNEKIKPNEWIKFKLELQPTYYHLLKNHKIGIVIYATDMCMTYRGINETIYTIDLNHTILNIPTI